MERIKDKSLVLQALWLLKNRPAQFYSTARGYLLFQSAHYLRRVFGVPAGVSLERNVRLQKNSALQVVGAGEISVGQDSIVYENAKVMALDKGRVSIGPESILGDIKIYSRCSVSIGARFLSSWNVFIQDYDPHPIESSQRAQQVKEMVQSFKPRHDGAKAMSEQSDWEFPGSEIVIGNDVWIGANVTILKGVVIGDGCIVASGAVVTAGVYPEQSVIGGNPAAVIKSVKAKKASKGESR